MAGNDVIGRKIAHLIEKEGKEPDQAAAIAHSMARRGELGPAARKVAPRRRKEKK